MTDTTTREVFIENKLDYSKFLVEPKQEVSFPEITKDMALSNLDKYSLMENELRQEVVSVLVLYPDLFPNSTKAFMRDIISSLQLHRSMNGFEAKLQRTGISENNQTIKTSENKNKTIFN